MIARPGRVYTRDELLTLVWDDHAESLDRTVDAHVKTLRAKLKAAQPRTVGQAGRLDGVTPAALGILAAHLRREARRKATTGISAAGG